MPKVSGSITLQVRTALPRDDGAVGDLLVRAFAAQYARTMPEVVMPPARLAELRNQAERRASATVLVAEADGALVGTVALYAWGSPGSEAWIPGAADLRFLAVDVAYLGRGFSGILLDRAEGEASAWGVPAICLHARRGVPGLTRLYEARGYVRDPAGDIDHLPQVFLEAYVLRVPR